MKEPLTHGLSHYPLMIRMEFAETGMEMAIGSGFVYEYLGFYYLITNGHCVTGINPETRTRISRHAGYPTVIKAGVRVRDSEYIQQRLIEHFRTDASLSAVDNE
jgi:hypothetical protein